MSPRVAKARLTPKETRLVKGVAESIKSGKDRSLQSIALEAGYGNGTNANSASVAACRALKNPKVESALEKALDKAGATLNASAKVIAEAHAADKVGVSKFGAVDLGPDHPTRLKAAEMNGRFRKLLANDKDDGGMVMGVGFFVIKGLKDRGLGE